MANYTHKWFVEDVDAMAFMKRFSVMSSSKASIRISCDESGSPDILTYIARTAHEVNRAYCLATGDTTQVAWEDAPEWQRESAINGVKFHIDNPNATPENSHENWLKEKIADGWVYGPVKNTITKEHPCCIPYNMLPSEQKVKDYLFRAVVGTMLGK